MVRKTLFPYKVSTTFITHVRKYLMGAMCTSNVLLNIREGICGSGRFFFRFFYRKHVVHCTLPPTGKGGRRD